MSNSITIGDSVLVKQDGNQVPGVVDEVFDDTVIVTIAAPYADAQGNANTKVTCPIDEVSPLLDDSGQTAAALPSEAEVG